MDARKTRIGLDELPDLFQGAASIVCARGKTIRAFDDPNDDELPAAALGRSGNLKAPAIRVGDRWVVGFGEAAWAGFFDRHG